VVTAALAREAYEVDTEVVDVDDPPVEAIARSRVATEDLTMHVLIHETGYWHRLHESTTKTACGIPVSLQRSQMQGRRLVEHPLAPRESGCECWTTEERREADDLFREKFGDTFRYPRLADSDET
jgi:hypothetical protein